MTTHPQPTARHKQRAATAVERAFELLARASAVEIGVLYEVPATTLEGLSKAEVADVLRAMGAIADFHLGHKNAMEILTAVEHPTPEGFAATIAEALGHQLGACLSQRDYGRLRAEYWASASAHKPEDDPDWPG